MTQTLTGPAALTRLTEDEALFRDSVYEFADKEIRPLSREMDEQAKMSRELVDKHRLMAAVWPNRVVEENNLSQQISTLRKLLGDTPDVHRFIVTVIGQGYRFVCDVERLEALPAGRHAQGRRRSTSRWRAPAIAAAGTAALTLGAVATFQAWHEARTAIAPPEPVAALPAPGGTRNVAAAAPSGPLKVSTTRTVMISSAFCRSGSTPVTSAANSALDHSNHCGGGASWAKRQACAVPAESWNTIIVQSASLTPRMFHLRPGGCHVFGHAFASRARRTPENCQRASAGKKLR